MMEMEINGRVRCCSTDVKKLSKRGRLLKSASPCLTSEVTRFENGFMPNWLLMEVLCRLPIKVVFRCKCVSRQWLSLISDPSFVRFYNASRVSASTVSDLELPCPPWVFIFKRMYVEGSELSHFPEDKLLEIMYPPANSTSPNYFVLPLPNSQEAKGDIYFIKAVDNGFVLYSWYHDEKKSDNVIGELYICNPMTKQWFPLPQPKYGSRRVSVGFTTQVEAGILRSYRVVLIHCHSQKRYFLEFEVFSSESGEWVEYTVCSPLAIRILYSKKPVFLNGNLHWEDCELGVIAYDPYTSPDKFRLLDFPADIDKECDKPRYGGLTSMCGVHQGLLKYFEVTRPFDALRGFSYFKIWVLEDYNSGRWCLQHTVANEDIIVDGSLYRRAAGAKLVSFHPYDADIVYLQWCRDLVSYNMRTRRLEALGIPHEPEKKNRIVDLECWLCFPLVLPAWPICIPSSIIPSYRT